MALTGNKGEWSEIYVLLKLLGEGKVYAGDHNLDKIKGLFYPIIKILRQEKENRYDYSLEGNDVVVQTSDGEELVRLPAAVFLDEASNLLYAINMKNGAFAVPKTEEFMNKIRCRSLKARSSDKTDIHIILHDCRTKINSEMGYSIKSQLGGDSTLLNASKATNLTFRIEGKDFSDSEINEINALNPAKKKVIRRVEEIKNKGGKLIFDKVDNDVFRRNLLMLDCCMPQVVASLLLEQLATGEPMLKELAKVLKEKDPLGISGGHDASFYEYKIKHLLTSAALGMMPATVWDGKFDANGGYIVVKKDGDVLCYHFYDRNRFEDYLFYNAYLERASTSKFEYAKIIKGQNGRLFFKLNLQIRLG